MLEPIVAAVLTYLAASVSFPQVIARTHGVDLHRAGTRNLGAGNLWREVGKLQGLTGGILDALKPPLAMLLGEVLGASRGTELLCGVVAIAAQQWPVWHRFDGGRGNAAALAFGVALSLRATMVALPFLIVFSAWAAVLRRRRHRRFSRGTPLGALAAIVLYPATAAWVGEGQAVVIAALVAGALVIARRLTAHLRDDLRISDDLGRILLNRLLFDRTEVQIRSLVDERR